MIIGTLINDSVYGSRAYKIEVLYQTEEFYVIRAIERTHVYFLKPYRNKYLSIGQTIRVKKDRIENLKEL